jgi:hypothetical protein
MAIWYDTKKPIRRIGPDLQGRYNYLSRTRRYEFSDGRMKAGSVSVHPDPRVQAVVEQAREAEMLQAIDRLRLIHTEKRKTVYILCSVPLDIPIDELVAWNQLRGTGGWPTRWRSVTLGVGTRCRWRLRNLPGYSQTCGPPRRLQSAGTRRTPRRTPRGL